MIINYLKEYFKNNNISQLDIESKTGISQSKLSLIFNGKRKITADEFFNMAIAYDININKIKEIIQSQNLK